MRISDWSSDVCSSDLPPSQKRPDPRMVRPLKFRDWRNLDNFLIRNHGHAVADGIQDVEIMGHHHDSKPQRVAQRPYQLVKFGSGDRVEARIGVAKEDRKSVV